MMGNLIEKSSWRQRVWFELGSAAPVSDRSRILQTNSNLVDGRLEVKLMIDCRWWLLLGGSRWLLRSSKVGS